jgi:hypothetical protein
MWHKWERRGKDICYQLESQKEKRPLGRPKCRWVDNIKMEIGWGGIDWNNLAQDTEWWRALVNTLTLWIPYNVESS